MSRPTWRIAALLAAIVAVSAFGGYSCGFQVAKAKARARANPDVWNVSAMRAMERELKLTPPQRQKIQSIIDGGVVELKSIRLETVRETDAIINRLIVEIDRELTPAQQASFAKLKQRRSPTTLDMLKVEPRKP
jgi:Spy/CpxP family protein refolding chaperone